ncbi:hypothetical protein K461DRAFT_269997 [Myriangium duriaei CBS 260.36]|uniref:Mediator of RNA polymerase II transcription subunit 18 n=1 Tax=Myriangium duriaei CBS 260.36 TaxID=1168546 RepID=A0A9P4IZK5_9PEZI|nr:hypothetical protein K461DRAFT_269997 [Myriangium duriaei CBS 260.36]
MHSLSLYAQIPSSRHTQALNILAGISGTQPRETYSHTLIYAPLRAATDPNVISKKSNAAGQQQQQQLSYVQLESEVTQADFGSNSGTVHDFTITTQDTPEPETRNLVLRRVTTEPEHLSQDDAKARFSQGSKYKFITDFVQEGHVLVHNDVILRLRRVLCFKPATGAAGLDRAEMPPLSELVLLDASGAWMLEATVRVEDRSKTALVRAASDQLQALRTELRGAIELRVPERLAMITRVRA